MTRKLRELSRREQLKIMGASAAGLASFAGCVGGDGDTDDEGATTDDTADVEDDSESDEDDEVDEDEETGPWSDDEADALFWAWGGLNDMRMEKAELFFEETDNRVMWEHFPFADFDTNLRSTLGGGDAPDLTSLSVSWLPEFASYDQLEELDYEDDLGIELVDGARENSSYDGTLYAYPWYIDCRMLGINTDAFEEAGLDIPDRTEVPTWDDFDEWMAAFEDDDLNGLTLSPEGFEMFWLSNGGEDATDDFEVRINEPEVVNTAEWMLEHVEDDNVALTPNSDVIEDWIAGAGAMCAHCGSWEYERINEEATFDWQYVPMPVGPDGDGTPHSWSAGVYYSVPVEAENPEIAHEFGEWLLSEEIQSELSLLGGEPAIESAYETDEYQEFIDDNPVYETILQEIHNTTTRVAHPERARVTDVSQEAGERVFQGQMTAQESYDEAATEIESYIQD
jgi:multiple sugar transport system substrate-binding protein